MTLQELFDIAVRHVTAMAVAMRLACVVKSYETGEALVIREPPAPAGPRGKRPREGTDWRRLVERNADTRRMHC